MTGTRLLLSQTQLRSSPRPKTGTAHKDNKKDAFVNAKCLVRINRFQCGNQVSLEFFDRFRKWKTFQELQNCPTQLSVLSVLSNFGFLSVLIHDDSDDHDDHDDRQKRSKKWVGRGREVGTIIRISMNSMIYDLKRSVDLCRWLFDPVLHSFLDDLVKIWRELLGLRRFLQSSLAVAQSIHLLLFERKHKLGRRNDKLSWKNGS